MIQDTTLFAYFKAKPRINANQVIVLDVFKAQYPHDLTNMEVSSLLGWSINRITPRVQELRKKGYIEDVGLVKCTITGNTAHAWRLI